MTPRGLLIVVDGGLERDHGLIIRDIDWKITSESTVTVRAPTRAAVMSLSSGMGLTFVNANVTVHAGAFILVAATTSPFGAAVAIAASSS